MSDGLTEALYGGKRVVCTSKDFYLSTPVPDGEDPEELARSISERTGSKCTVVG